MAAVLVVGAGVTGLLTAIECALAGHRVTVLDRGDIPNPSSTSFDQHRAIRTLDPAGAAPTRRMVAAHHRWLELEALLGTSFYRRVGVVTAWPQDRVGEVTGIAADAGAPVTTVTPDALPHLGFPAGTAGVFEVYAGVLLADRVLRSAASWLARHPAVTLRPGCEVTSADVHSGQVTLADGTTLGADLVMVAAGPWSADLVELPVVLHRQIMVYLRPPANLAHWWENAPAAGRLGADGRAWLLPPGAGTFLKISSDAVCRTGDDSGDNSGDTARLLASSIVSDVDSYTVVAVKPCHYATSASGGAVFERVGPAAWSRAACGGNGFSTAPLVAAQIVESMTAEAA